MDERISKLKHFIEKYGKDYLGDGTKKKIIIALENEDKKLAMEILNSINTEWINRTKEIGQFLVFTDSQSGLSDKEKVIEPFYKSNYIDSLTSNQKHIPTLRRVISREQYINWDVWEK